MNNFNGVGRVGNEPEVRKTAKGDVASFNVAIPFGFGDNQVTTWFKVALFDKRASVAQYIHKGDLIGISGAVVLTEYDAKDGTTKASLELKFADVTLIGKVSKAEEVKKPKQVAPKQDDEFFDDLPF